MLGEEILRCEGISIFNWEYQFGHRDTTIMQVSYVIASGKLFPVWQVGKYYSMTQSEILAYAGSPKLLQLNG